MTRLGEFSECSIPVGRSYPDNISDWPEYCRKAAFTARDLLLKENPERHVIEEVSYCIGRDHPRFPENTRLSITHILVFQVYLDGDADPSYRWDEVKRDWESA